MKINDKEKIEKFLQSRNITSIFHFTDVQNLGFILCNKKIGGLRTIDDLEKYKKKDPEFYYSKNDRMRHKYKEGICLSVSNINRKLLYVYRERYPENNYVIIELNPKILIEKDCCFFTTNSSNSNILKDQIDRYSSFEAFYSLFKPDEYYIKSQESMILYKKNCPIDDQAEAICFQTIELRYFKCIYYKDDDERISRIKAKVFDIPFIKKEF